MSEDKFENKTINDDSKRNDTKMKETIKNNAKRKDTTINNTTIDNTPASHVSKTKELEDQYLQNYNQNDYDRPFMAVDITAFTLITTKYQLPILP